MGLKDNLLDRFSYLMITTIWGEPTYGTIRDLQQKLLANTVYASTSLGGGAHGYLALTVKPEVYFNLTRQVFTPPTGLGPMPNFLPGTDVTQTAMLKKQHNEMKCIFNEYNSMNNALKQLVVSAIEITYIRSLQHPIVSFLSVTPLIYLLLV